MTPYEQGYYIFLKMASDMSADLVDAKLESIMSDNELEVEVPDEIKDLKMEDLSKHVTAAGTGDGAGSMDTAKVAEFFTEEPKRFEKYLPWGTAAAMGTAGTALGSKLPGKWKLPGQALGAAAGTMAGVFGGETVGKRLDE